MTIIQMIFVGALIIILVVALKIMIPPRIPVVRYGEAMSGVDEEDNHRVDGMHW